MSLSPTDESLAIAFRPLGWSAGNFMHILLFMKHTRVCKRLTMGKASVGGPPRQSDRQGPTLCLAASGDKGARQSHQQNRSSMLSFVSFAPNKANSPGSGETGGASPTLRAGRRARTHDLRRANCAKQTQFSGHGRDGRGTGTPNAIDRVWEPTHGRDALLRNALRRHYEQGFCA